MKVYIWERVSQATSSYHAGGAVVVFAETEERARELANKEEGCSILLAEAVTEIREASGEEKVFIFQDAGCC